MGIIGMVMKVFSYLFHLFLALFMLGVAFVSLLSGIGTLQIAVLPWQGTTLSWCLLAAGLVGIASVVLAIKRTLPVVFMVWSFVVLVMLLRGYLFSSYHFDYSIGTPIYLTLAAILAAVGGWLQFREKPQKLRTYERSAAF